MQRHHRVIIIDCDHGSIDPEEAVFKDTDTDLTLANLKARKEIIQLCGNADGLIVQYAVLDKDILKELTKCKVISRYGVGVDTIDVEAATDLGIIVTNVPDYGVEEVSTPRCG